MRTLLFCLTAVATISTLGCGKGFGSGFEGEITMHTTRPGETGQDMVVMTKGDKLRFDTPTAAGADPTHAIFDPGANKVVVIIDSKKSYMDMDFGKPSAAPNTDPVTSAVTKSGKHETIAGADCEDWTVADPSGKKSEVCIAQGVAFFDVAALKGGGGGSFAKDLREKKLFPLKSVEYDAGGKEVSRMEVTKIEKKKLDAALFTVPADYTKIELPSMPAIPTPKK